MGESEYMKVHHTESDDINVNDVFSIACHPGKRGKQLIWSRTESHSQTIKQRP